MCWCAGRGLGSVLEHDRPPVASRQGCKKTKMWEAKPDEDPSKTAVVAWRFRRKWVLEYGTTGRPAVPFADQLEGVVVVSVVVTSPLVVFVVVLIFCQGL